MTAQETDLWLSPVIASTPCAETAWKVDLEDAPEIAPNQVTGVPVKGGVRPRPQIKN